MLPHIRILLFIGISFLSVKLFFLDERYVGEIQVQDTSNLHLLASDINEDIQSGRFYQAEERIRQIGMQTSIIASVVNIMRETNLSNLQLLIDRCALSLKILIQYSVYESYWEKLHTNDESDLFRLISLYEVFNNDFIHQNETPEEIRSRATALRDNTMRDVIIRRSAETISDAVFGGYYQNSTNMQSLAKALESLDEQISDDTIRMVVEKLYLKMPKTDLVRNVYNTDSVSQSVTALLSIHESLSVKGSLYGVIGLLFAEHFSRLQELPDYAKLSEDKKTASTRVVNSISDSIRNFYFSQKICIRNAHYLESIYSPIDDYKWSTTRRHVFTWLQRVVDARAQWIPKKILIEEQQELLFHLKSDFNKNEFLYIPNVPPYSDQYRHVMTWISGPVDISRTLWQIQAIKKNLALINVLNNEYLCLSNEMFSDNRRYVFTKRDVEQSSHPPKECVWMVDAC